MNLGLRDRVAFVCASTGGLGLASARTLSAEGARVAVTGPRAKRVAEVAAELSGARGFTVDLNEPGAMASHAQQVERALGPIDIVVLNGPGPAPTSASAMDASAVGEAVRGLVQSHVEILRATLPGMRRRGYGRVVAIGSSAVVSPLPGLAASNLGRSALVAYLKTLAAEVASDGVTVNVVLPGRIATDRVAALDAFSAQRTGRPVAEVKAASESSIPVGRYGSPEEFAAVVAFLCSRPASYVTGSIVRCDGGMLTAL